MEARRVLWLALILAALAGGCATPTKADLARAESAGVQLTALLEGFSAAVRNDDVPAAMALVWPDLRPAERSRLRLALQDVVWLRGYSGYRVDAERAVSRLGWRSLRKAAVQTRVEGRNEGGARLRDGYVLVEKDSQWFVADFVFHKPLQGEWLDPPQGQADGIKAVVESIFTSLKAGRPAEVYVALPKDDRSAHLRAGRRCFLQKLLGLAPASYSILQDLDSMREFQILSWPDPQKDFELIYVSPGVVAAVYEMYYMWPDGGVVEADILRMYLFFSRTEDRWRFQRIRLIGKGIPGSQ